MTCQVAVAVVVVATNRIQLSLFPPATSALGPNYPTDLPVKRNTFSETPPPPSLSLPCLASALRRGAIDHTNDYYLSVVQANELSKREGERLSGREREAETRQADDLSQLSRVTRIVCYRMFSPKIRDEQTHKQQQKTESNKLKLSVYFPV